MNEHPIFGDIRSGREDSFHYIDTAALASLSESGETPVQTATYHGRADLASRLLDRTPKPAFASLVVCGTAEQVSKVLASGQNPSEMTPDGFTPLSLAAAFNTSEVVRVLLEAGAHPNQKSLSLGGVAPIHAAVFGRKPANLRLLLERGADANLAQQGGFTPLHGAMQNGDQESIVALLAYGANVNAKTDEGKTPADFVPTQAN